MFINVRPNYTEILGATSPEHLPHDNGREDTFFYRQTRDFATPVSSPPPSASPEKCHPDICRGPFSCNSQAAGRISSQPKGEGLPRHSKQQPWLAQPAIVHPRGILHSGLSSFPLPKPVPVQGRGLRWYEHSAGSGSSLSIKPQERGA